MCPLARRFRQSTCAKKFAPEPEVPDWDSNCETNQLKARDSESPFARIPEYREAMRSGNSNVVAGFLWRQCNDDENNQSVLLTRCAPGATRRSAWLDLPPSGRAAAGTIGRVEALGYDAFVSLGNGGGEERAASTHDALRTSNLGNL